MKKYIAFLIVLCLLFGTACKQTRPQGETWPVSSTVAPPATPTITYGENTEQAEALGAVAGETMAVQYTEDFYPFSGGYTVKDAARVGDNLLFLGIKEDSYMMGLSSYTVDAAARVTISETRMIALDEPEGENEAITYNITAGADGYFYVLTGNETEDRYPEMISVLRYSPTGEFQEKMTISDWPEKTVLRDAKVMGDGKVVLQSDNLIAVYQWQGSLLSSQAVNDGYILSSSNTAEGVIFNTGNYYLLDGATMELTRLNPSWPDGNVYALSFTDCQNLSGEYIINEGGSFIQYDFDADVADVLLRWNYSANSTGSFGPACRVSEFSFVCVFTDQEAVQITGMELVPFVDRSVVNVALIGVSDYAISEINNKSQLYEYHAVSYGEDEINRFLTEMMAGNVPDLVLFKGNINTDAGSFEDLYAYIDADPDISRESFIPNYLDALDVGGELHQLWDLSQAGVLDIQLAEQTNYRKRLDDFREQKRVLYERLLLHEISVEEYKGAKAAIDRETERLEQLFTTVKAQTAQKRMDADMKKARHKLAQDVSGAGGLTAGLADALIERVYVYPGNQIDIEWKIKDFCAED